MFWQLHFDDNNALAQLADRVLHTLANSVPCERAFSALNVGQDGNSSKPFREFAVRTAKSV
jgi:hypothetical protein